MIERPDTPRTGPGIPLLFSLVTLAIYALTRIGLALWTGLAAVPVTAWAPMLAQGLWFDLAALTTLLAPVLLYEAALPNRWRASRPHRFLRFVWFALILSVLLFCAVAEATFWLEFATRFNFIAVDYLLYTHEVIGNIRESTRSRGSWPASRWPPSRSPTLCGAGSGAPTRSPLPAGAAWSTRRPPWPCRSSR